MRLFLYNDEQENDGTDIFIDVKRVLYAEYNKDVLVINFGFQPMVVDVPKTTMNEKQIQKLIDLCQKKYKE